jgi:phage tail tape-measure protein
MLPASSTEKGQCVAFPDVCKTPAGPAVVPVPYPNMAQLNQTKMPTASKTVFLVGKNAVTENSEITMSSGDEAGSLGGVISGAIKGPCKFKLGSSVVFIEGYAAAYCGSLIGQNGNNNNAPIGTQVAPSQNKVFVSP